jgi:putative endonuclease
MFYVYVLESGEHRYMGSTKDLRRRVKEHNAGQNQTTKAYAPWTVIHYEAYISSDDAKRREKYFKSSPGRTALSKMLRSYYNNKKQSGLAYQRSTSGKAKTA